MCWSRSFNFQRDFGNSFGFNLTLANLSAKFFQLFPKPLLTQDQLRLLKYDNIVSGKYKTNKDIGVPSKLSFKEEVKKYAYMWKEGGQFSTNKYNFNKNSQKMINRFEFFFQ